MDMKFVEDVKPCVHVNFCEDVKGFFTLAIEAESESEESSDLV